MNEYLRWFSSATVHYTKMPPSVPCLTAETSPLQLRSSGQGFWPHWKMQMLLGKALSFISHLHPTVNSLDYTSAYL